jgi:hypothetical protein
MRSKASKAIGAVGQTVKGVSKVIKPAVRGVYRVLANNAEAAALAGGGYWLGNKIDNTPFIRRVSGGAAKWILGGAGFVFGLNYSLARRKLNLSKRMIDKSLNNAGNEEKP